MDSLIFWLTVLDDLFDSAQGRGEQGQIHEFRNFLGTVLFYLELLYSACIIFPEIISTRKTRLDPIVPPVIPAGGEL